jgi:hypothetical protein
MYDESDLKGVKAEKEKNIKTQVVLYSQANALRKGAKEKGQEIEIVDKEIQEKEALLKSL